MAKNKRAPQFGTSTFAKHSEVPPARLGGIPTSPKAAPPTPAPSLPANSMLAAWHALANSKEGADIIASCQTVIFDPRLPNKMLHPHLNGAAWALFQRGWNAAIAETLGPQHFGEAPATPERGVSDAAEAAPYVSGVHERSRSDSRVGEGSTGDDANST